MNRVSVVTSGRPPGGGSLLGDTGLSGSGLGLEGVPFWRPPEGGESRLRETGLSESGLTLDDPPLDDAPLRAPGPSPDGLREGGGDEPGGELGAAADIAC